MVIILLPWVTFAHAAAASTERYYATFQLCHHPPALHSGFATVVEVKLPVKTALCCGVACLLEVGVDDSTSHFAD